MKSICLSKKTPKLFAAALLAVVLIICGKAYAQQDGNNIITGDQAIKSFLDSFKGDKTNVNYKIVSGVDNNSVAEGVEIYFTQDPGTKITMSKLRCSNASYQKLPARLLNCDTIAVSGYRSSISTEYLNTEYELFGKLIKNIIKRVGGKKHLLDEDFPTLGGKSANLTTASKTVTADDVTLPAGYIFYKNYDKAADLISDVYNLTKLTKYSNLKVTQLSSSDDNSKFTCDLYTEQRAINGRNEGMECQNLAVVARIHELKNDAKFSLTAKTWKFGFFDLAAFDHIFDENAYVNGRGDGRFLSVSGDNELENVVLLVYEDTPDKAIVSYSLAKATFKGFDLRQFDDVRYLYAVTDLFTGGDVAKDPENLNMLPKVYTNLLTMWRFKGMSITNNEWHFYDDDNDYKKKMELKLGQIKLNQMAWPRIISDFEIKDISLIDFMPENKETDAAKISLASLSVRNIDVARLMAIRNTILGKGIQVLSDTKADPALPAEISFADFAVMNFDNTKLFSIRNFAIKSEYSVKYKTPVKIEQTYKDLYINLDLIGKKRPIYRSSALEQLPFKDFTIENYMLSLSLDPDKRTLLAQFELDSPVIASIKANAGLSDIPDLVKGFDNSSDSEKFEMLAQTKLDYFNLNINDAQEFVPVILTHVAKKLKTDATANDVKQVVNANLTVLATRDIAQNVGRFLDNGNSLRIIARPDAPIPLSTMPLMYLSGPKAVINKLNLEVEGN